MQSHSSHTRRPESESRVLPISSWPKATNVRIEGNWLKYSIDQGRKTRFEQAYSDGAHEEFLQCKTDNDLCVFVRHRGPITKAEQYPLSLLRAKHQEMNALVVLKNTSKAKRGLPQALQGFLTAWKQGWDESETYFGLRELNNLVGDTWGMLPAPPEIDDDWPWTDETVKTFGTPFEWCATADYMHQLQYAGRLLSKFLNPNHPWLVLVPDTKSGRMMTQYSFSSLLEAIRWMVWQSEATKHPMKTCPVCGTPFRQEHEREKIYCSYKCQHRVAMRRNRAKPPRRQSRRRA
jgi:hypothetical protein